MDHISYSQISMYLRCPRQYDFRYIQGLKIPPSGALIVGKSGHSTIEVNHRQKIETEKDRPLSEWKEFFSDKYDKMSDATEIRYLDGEERGALKDQGIGLITSYRKTISPKIKPRYVEEEFNIPFSAIRKVNEKSVYNNITLTGFWDVIDKKTIIRDTKFVSKKPSQHDVDSNLQLSIYAIAYRYRFNNRETKLTLDVTTKTKEPKSISLYTKRIGEQIKFTKRQIADVVRAIKSEIIYPCDPSSWWCTDKWCGYYKLCKTGKKVFY